MGLSEAMKVNEATPRCSAEAGDRAVPPGYQRTEVGVIPGDWTPGVLSRAIAELQAGVSVNSTAEDLGPGVPAILKTSCVESGAFLPHEAKAIAPKDRHRAKFTPRSETILISRMNTIDLVGECGFVDQSYPNLFIPDRLWMVVFHSSSSVSPRWLAYVLSSTAYRKQLQAIATGTSGSMKNIAKGALLRLHIAYPRAAEQRAIAEALSDVDGLLGALEALIAKKRAIKQGAMQQLLSGKMRLPGFSGEWPTKRLGEIGRFRGGSGFPTKHQGQTEGDYPLFKVSDMNNEGNDTFMQSANNYITEAVRAQLGATVFPAGSIVFAKVGAAVFLERKRILTNPSCIDNNMSAFTLNDTLADCRYVHYALVNMNLGDFVSTTALPSLSGSVLCAIEVYLPAFPEQNAIAAALSDMDVEIAALEARRDKTRDIKQGMMQQLLTGRVRLVTPASAVAAS